MSAYKDKRRALMTTADAAAYLSLTQEYLCRMRQQRRGPEYIRLGNQVRYRPEVIEAWLQSRTIQTSETTATMEQVR